MPIKIRTQQNADIPNIITLYNMIVDNGGYSQSAPEFNRHITEQDWLDWQAYYSEIARLVFEKDGKFYGFSTLRDMSSTEVIHEHLGVYDPLGPGVEEMWAIVDWIKSNTEYETMVMDRADLTNVEHFD